MPIGWTEFVTSSECIVSCPGVAFIAGEHVVLRGAVAACVRVPQRVFVGLEVVGRYIARANESPMIDMGTPAEHLAFVSSQNRWEELSWLSESEAAPAAASLTSQLGRIAERLTLPGTIIRVRSRHLLSPSTGPNWSGAFSSALVAALYVLAEELTVEAVESWAEQPLNRLAQKGAVFDRCNRDAWGIENSFHGGISSGYGTFCSLTSSPDPVLYVTAGTDSGLVTDTGDLRYSGVRITDTVDTPTTSLDSFPGFGLAVINSGAKKNTAAAIEIARTEVPEEMVEAAIWAREIFTIPGLEQLSSNSVLGTVVASSSFVRETHMESLAMSSITTIDALRRLYDQHGYRDRNALIERFAGAVRRLQGSLTQLGLDWPEMYQIAGKIYEVAQRHGLYDSLAMKLTGGGGGGSLICIVPMTESRTHVGDTSFLSEFDQLLDDLSQDHELSAQAPRVDWRSWRDGIEPSGLRIERTSGSGSTIGIPQDGRGKYAAFEVEFVDIEVQAGQATVARRRKEVCGPTDQQRMVDSGGRFDQDQPDLVIGADPRSGRFELFAWGRRLDLDISATERHGYRRQILTVALVALSKRLALPQLEAYRICRYAIPARSSGAESPGWTRRYCQTRLANPFNEEISRAALSSIDYSRACSPLIRLEEDLRGAVGAEYNYSIRLSGSGDGLLRIAVLHPSLIRQLTRV